ncbi:hypothetical protein WUBG_04144, partial [Wuchereria bancrofti]
KGTKRQMKVYKNLQIQDCMQTVQNNLTPQMTALFGNNLNDCPEHFKDRTAYLIQKRPRKDGPIKVHFHIPLDWIITVNGHLLLHCSQNKETK